MCGEMSCAEKYKAPEGPNAGRRLFSPELREPVAQRVFSPRTIRPLGPTGASGPTPGVRPASRPCMRIGALPSAWLLQARQCALRRRAGEGSEGRSRGLGPPVEVFQDLFDHCRIFDARGHFHRAAAVFAGQEVDLEHPLQPLCLRLIDAWRAGAGSFSYCGIISWQ